MNLMSLNHNISVIVGKKKTHSLNETLSHTLVENLVKRKEETFVLTLALIYAIAESADLVSMKVRQLSATAEKLKEQSNVVKIDQFFNVEKSAKSSYLAKNINVKETVMMGHVSPAKRSILPIVIVEKIMML